MASKNNMRGSQGTVRHTCSCPLSKSRGSFGEDCPLIRRGLYCGLKDEQETCGKQGFLAGLGRKLIGTGKFKDKKVKNRTYGEVETH